MKRLARHVALTVIAVPIVVVGLAFLFLPSPRRTA